MNNDNNKEWISLGILGEEEIKKGNIELAKQYLSKSIALHPSAAWPYLLLSSITENNDEAIELIKQTKNIELTEWYYISLIEKYKTEIEILKKDLIKKYNISNLKNDGAIIYLRQLFGFKDFVLPMDQLSISNLGSILNKWECIALLCTGQEYRNGTYQKFINNIYDTVDINISKNIHFKLIIKNKHIIYYNLPNKFNQLFASAEVVSIDIPEDKDIYIGKSSDDYDLKIIKEYGSKYGPNFIFFQTMKKLSMYNTSLLLECDCLLFSNWMKRIDNYISSQSLLISGSQSDTPNDEKFLHIRNRHINGGTAIYATGFDIFQNFITLCENLWLLYIKHHSVDLPYDYILLLIIEDYFNHSTNRNDKIVWSYIKKHYIYTTLVCNWSDTTPRDYDPLAIRDRFNPAILHQKP